MLHACTLPRSRASTRTGKYAIFIAFPLQQFLRERASVLRYMYITCLVWLAVAHSAFLRTALTTWQRSPFSQSCVCKSQCHVQCVIVPRMVFISAADYSHSIKQMKFE